jgi:hypothetical protein
MIEAPPSWPIYAATAVAILGSLLYLAMHLIGLVRMFRSVDNDPIAPISVAAWSISFLGGFTGPCVVPINLLALVLGGLALMGHPSERTRICAQTGIAAGLILLSMTLIMLALLLPMTPELQ